MTKLAPIYQLKMSYGVFGIRHTESFLKLLLRSGSWPFYFGDHEMLEQHGMIAAAALFALVEFRHFATSRESFLIGLGSAWIGKGSYFRSNRFQ